MTPLGAAVLLGAGGVLLAAWAGCLLFFCCREPSRSETILARTGVSAFQGVGGTCCAAVFSALWTQTLSSCALGETAALDLPVLLWSSLLAPLGMAVVWMTTVRRVWCTDTALVQRTWRGQLITVPYREIAGAVASFSFDDVTIPWGEKKLVLDSSMTGFREVADCLGKHGVDLSKMPPKRPSFFRRNKDQDDPFSGRR